MNDQALAPTGTPALPTYHTVADVLEKKNGSGVRLVAWTVLRTLMIAPPMMLVGVPAKQAFAGAAISSGLISVFTLLRISEAAKEQGLGGSAVELEVGGEKRGEGLAAMKRWLAEGRGDA